MEKHKIREQMLSKRQKLRKEDIQSKSLQAERMFCAMEEFQKADRVFAYKSVNGEMDTSEIITRALHLGKEVYLPKVTGKHEMEFYRIFSEEEVAPGKYGILEPVSDELVNWSEHKNSVMIVPGVAFDEEGNRIGYGAGFYDRYFTRISKGNPNILIVAMAYDFQVLKEIPSEPFDWKMDRIVTQNQVIDIEKLILT